VEEQSNAKGKKEEERGRERGWLRASYQDILIVFLMGALLYYGASWQLAHAHTDAARYQCYALAFWQGMPALRQRPETQCEFLTQPATTANLTVISQTTVLDTLRQWHAPTGLIQFAAGQESAQPFHVLPNEYPWLTLFPFTLGMIAPLDWYQLAFALWMILFAAGVYLLLRRWRSRAAALVYALYLVCGAWGTLAGRFDILPAGLTLLAVMCAERKRWSVSFALLALATLFKFYPLVLLAPFLLAQQHESGAHWYARRRWQPLGAFVFVCLVVVAVSLCLNIAGTLAPLSYFGARPVQVEALPASLLWLFSVLGLQAATYAYTFGSLNMYSGWAGPVSTLVTLFLAGGLVYTFWLQWRGKISLALASLLTLLIVMITGKVFSPQYLIWVIPLVAYIGQGKRTWVVFWCVIGLLTTWIYPYIYNMADLLEVPGVPLFFPVTTLRNLLFASFIVYILLKSSGRTIRPSTGPLQKAGLVLPAEQETPRATPDGIAGDAGPAKPA
jgi:hypothetical protein